MHRIYLRSLLFGRVRVDDGISPIINRGEGANFCHSLWFFKEKKQVFLRSWVLLHQGRVEAITTSANNFLSFSLSSHFQRRCQMLQKMHECDRILTAPKSCSFSIGTNKFEVSFWTEYMFASASHPELFNEDLLRFLRLFRGENVGYILVDYRILKVLLWIVDKSI